MPSSRYPLLGRIRLNWDRFFKKAMGRIKILEAKLYTERQKELEMLPLEKTLIQQHFSEKHAT